MNVAAPNEAVVEVTFDASKPDLETVFHAQYDRIARVIACILRDPARGEELAVDVFLKWSRNAAAQGDNSGGWLYRTAVRMGLNELRRQTRRNGTKACSGGSRAVRQSRTNSSPRSRSRKEFAKS